MLPRCCRSDAARPIAVAVGLLLDLAFGDAPLRPHPVARFGSAMARLERVGYRDSRRAGAVHASVGASLGAVAAAVTRSTAVATYVVSAPRGLATAALDVHAALDAGDLATARRLLPTLAGRDPDHLGADEIARAVVESVAESTVDAVVAPAFWALVAGAAGAGAHRAVNTLDSMVGHRTARYERFGWASARLDDAMAYVPARCAAVLCALVRPHRAVRMWEVVRRDAPAHPSPNAGVVEAAFAAALDLRLGGTNVYDGVADRRPLLGDGRPPQSRDIARAVALSRDVTWATIGGLVLAGWFGRRRWRARR